MPSGLDHSADLNGRQYTVELLARVSHRDVGPKAIRDWLAAQGYVAGATYKWPLGTPTETDLGAFLQRVQVRHNSTDGKTYKVTLSYGSFDASGDGPANGAGVTNWVMDPTTQRPLLSWSSEDREFFPTHDRDGKPILNAAGDAYDPGPSIPLPTPVATVTRVEAVFNPAWITIYKGTVNEDAWMGFPPESVLCKDITAAQFSDPDNGRLLHTVVYTFAFRPSIVGLVETGIKVIPGWGVQVLNAGRRELKTDAEHLTPIRKAVKIDGKEVSDPVPLQADGTYDPEGSPTYKIYNIYPKSDFSYFNLPEYLFEGL